MVQMKNVRIGVHPINWCNDDMTDPLLGDGYSFYDIIDQAAEAGYAGIENSRKFPRDAKVLKPEFDKRGLELTSGWCDTMFACKELRDEYFEGLKEKAKFFLDMGAKYVIAAEGTGSSCWDPREYRAAKGVQKLNEEEWKLFTDGLNMAGRFCKDNGLTLVYHVHTGTCVETFDETQKLCDMTDPEYVNLLADTGHLCFCGVNIPEFYERFADRIKYVHLKNIRPLVLQVVREFGIDFNNAVKLGIFTVPGDDGAVDFQTVFEILAKHNYEGWMLVEAEQYLPSPSALHFAKMARSYIRQQTGL